MNIDIHTHIGKVILYILLTNTTANEKKFAYVPCIEMRNETKT